MPLNARDVGSILGRNQGPELFFQQPFAAGTQPIIPKNLNLNRPMERLHLVFRGRVTIGVANYAAVAAEAPATILQRIRVFGTHRRFGALVPIDIPGATAFAFPRLFRQRGPSLYINGVRQPELDVPLSQSPATFGNVGAYDLEIHYDIPVVPIFPPAAKIAGVPFMWQQADWGDTLQIQLFLGDLTSFGTPGAGTTVAFSAFGSGAGSPTISLFQNFEILGPLSQAIQSAVMIRSSQFQTAPVSAIANNVRLQLLQKQKTTNIIFKTGINLAGTNPGVQVFGSLNETILDFTQPVVDNKPIRNNFNNFAAKEYFGYAFDTVLPGGYNGFTFVDSLNPLTYYRGDQIAGGSTFELDSNVLTNTANQMVEILQEQVIGEPGVAAGQ